MPDDPKTFVLVHGAWHGGWCWAETARHLRAHGHRVLTPTLTGLAERQHLVSAVEGPETHVADIVNLILWEDLRDVTLVGHSYAGMVITGVASDLPDRLAHLVYLDAFVPERSGQSASQMRDPALVAEAQALLQADGTILPYMFERWSSSPETIAWLKKMTTPHPAICFEKPLVLSGREAEVQRRSYIFAAKNRPSHFEPFFERYRTDPNWKMHSLPCLHDVMVEMPEALADILHEG